MKHNIYFIIISVFLFTFFYSCDDSDITPAFIEINLEELSSQMDVATFNADHETYYDENELKAIANQNFKDVWVYVNGDRRGLYELPCRVPILEYDSVNIIIMPAVRLNGMSSIRPPYPFTISGFRKKYYLKKGETTVVDSPPLMFKYDRGVQIPFLETFENFSTSFAPLYTNMGANIETTILGEGQVGVVSLHDSLSFMIASSAVKVPCLGEYAFLEFNYMCDEDLNISFLVTNGAGIVIPVSFATLRPTKTWKKAYINLTTTLLNYNGGGSYSTANIQIIFSGLKEKDQDDINYYFDNIKVIYQ